MYDHYSSYHSQREEPTPQEKCRQLLLALRKEQLKTEPDANELTRLHLAIASVPMPIRAKAFDMTVDMDGW